VRPAGIPTCSFGQANRVLAILRGRIPHALGLRDRRAHSRGFRIRRSLPCPGSSLYCIGLALSPSAWQFGEPPDF
jgi:hypothetical protein